MSTQLIIDSVSKFVEFVVSWKKEGKAPIAFRGQKYHEWKAVPKIFRPDIGMLDYERESVRDIVAVHPQEFSQDNSMFDRLVRMQHFDLPTRLLDATSNPLVALYFASQEHRLRNKKTGVVTENDGKVFAFFVPNSRMSYYDSDKVSCISALANLTPEEKEQVLSNLHMGIDEFNKLPAMIKLHHYIGMEKPHFKAIVDPDHFKRAYYVMPKMSNKRIIAQSGAFIIHPQPPKYVKSGPNTISLKNIIIPANTKKDIRKELELLGMHGATLFPEIDKAANFIVAKYKSRVVADRLSDVYGRKEIS